MHFNKTSFVITCQATRHSLLVPGIIKLVSLPNKLEGRQRSSGVSDGYFDIFKIQAYFIEIFII